MMSRRIALAFVAALLAAIAVSAAFGMSSEPKTYTHGYRTIGTGQIRYKGLGPERWAAETRRTRRALRGEEAHSARLRRLLVSREHELAARERRLERLAHELAEARAKARRLAALAEPEAAPSTLDPIGAIRYAFGDRADEAIAVSRCESGFKTTAANGQYLGMFQMGENERATYGHGDTPLEQAEAAHRYFIASGSDWSPWTCKPWS